MQFIIMRHVLVAVIFMLALAHFAQAQVPADGQESDAVPEQAIEYLHQGLLVVRLPGFSKQIDHAKSQFDTQKGEDHRYATGILVTTYMNRAILYNSYLKALQNAYDFSRVAFIYDHETGEFLEGQVKPRAFDLATRVETDAFDHIYLLTLDQLTNSEAGVLTIRTTDLKPVGRPFPNGFISGGIAGVFAVLKDEHAALSQVRRMNKKLWKYHARSAVYRARQQ